MAKNINVTGCIHAVDEGKTVVLHAAKNPHEVSDALAKELTDAGLASGVAGRPSKSQAAKPSKDDDSKAGA